MVRIRRVKGTDDHNGKKSVSTEIVIDLDVLVPLFERADPCVNALIAWGYRRAVNIATTMYYVSFRVRMPWMLFRRRRLAAGFERRLARRWKRGLDLFETAMMLAQDLGAGYNRRHRAQAAAHNDLVFDALTRIHATACRTASEILELLKSGHAEGAHARWRTLHELAVVAYFIDKHGDDAADRYFRHATIDSYRRAELYRKHETRLGLEPFEDAEFAALEAAKEDLCQRFGKAFARDYGWAATVLGRERVSFTDIERDVGLEHWRPYYRMASGGVHAHAKGILWSLGLIGDRQILLAGPSNAGLADPGHGALLSLMQITTTLLLQRSIRHEHRDLVMLRSLGRLVDEAGAAFLAAHHRLEADEVALAKRDPQRNTAHRRRSI